jgi:tetratricopeptide (TPR) repeat protein
VPRVAPQFEGFLRLWSRHDLNGEAIAEYQQVLRDMPTAVDVHLGLITLLRRERRWADIVTAYDGLIKLEPKTAAYYAQRGESRGYLAELGQARWQDVAADFARTCELGGGIGDWYRRAMLALQADDREQYVVIVKEILARFGAADNLDMLNNVAFLCGGVPGVVTDLELPIRLARTCVVGAPTNRDYQNTLAITLLRAGRLDEAQREFEKSLQMTTLDIDGFDWLYLAMIHHRQGRVQEARDLLAKADAWAVSRLDPKSLKTWPYRLSYRVLHAQAIAALAK